MTDAYTKALGRQLERKRAALSKRGTQRVAALDMIRTVVSAARCKTPPVELGRLARHLSVTVRHVPLAMKGRITLEDGELIAEVDESLTDFQARFTLAHELSHVILERDRISLLRLSGDEVARDIGYGALEELCNVAAAEIVLPESWLLDRIRGAVPALETICEIAAETKCDVLFVAKQLCGIWNVRFLVWEVRGRKMVLTETVPWLSAEQLDLYKSVDVNESILGKAIAVSVPTKGTLLLVNDLEASSYQAECIALRTDSVLSMILLTR
jgi:hypothetical protein